LAVIAELRDELCRQRREVKRLRVENKILRDRNAWQERMSMAA
jgi:hypothetical protein